MSMRYQAAILTASYDPLKVPDAPTIGTASQASGTSISTTFTAPSNVGGGAITGYIATAKDSSSGAEFTATGSSSPIVVTGLTTGNTYTVKVAAINNFGTGPASAASNSVTPSVIGQQEYITAGSYSWVAPTGVTSVSVVAVGGGAGGNSYPQPVGYAGGGAGGGLGYKNAISVTPGNSYTVVVGAGGAIGASGGDSYFVNTSTVKGGGGTGGNYTQNWPGGTYTGDGGGNGGRGMAPVSGWVGGGGAGGYAGAGGDGGVTGGSAAQNGTGGSAAGGSSGGSGGGGVGILGQGASGTTGSTTRSGSGGETTTGLARGFYYGGGGGGNDVGAVGAVRIIWPGTTRSFPSTNTGNL